MTTNPRTLKGVISVSYERMKQKVERTGDTLPSKVEFTKLLLQNEEFTTVATTYVRTGWIPELMPLVKQVYPEVQFVKKGEDIESRQPVCVRFSDGEKKFYSSPSVAEKELGFPQGVLCRAVRTKKPYKGIFVRKICFDSCKDISGTVL